MAGQEDSHKISRVHRSKEEAKKTYDRISTVYNWLGGIFERRPTEKALSYLKVESGEMILEIGFGTGYCFQRIALAVGNTGKAYGIDVSEGMLQVTRKRLQKAGLWSKAGHACFALEHRECRMTTHHWPHRFPQRYQVFAFGK